MPQPDRWLVLTASVDEADPLRELLSEGLLALGGLSVLEDAGSLTTYLPAAPADALDDRIRQAQTFLADWLGDDPPALNAHFKDNEDWEREWKRGLQPRRVSSRFVIRPSWTDYTAGDGEHVVVIDPEMAFGTGEHATTRGCLRLLDSLELAGARVCDVGSGSAILSIAAAMAGARQVVAIEYDPDANLNARDNLDRNGVADRIQIVEAFADAELLADHGPFDLIIANILSSVIRPLLPAFHASLAPAGRLIVSGILQSESEEMVAAAERAGFSLGREDREEEWWSAEFSPSR